MDKFHEKVFKLFKSNYNNYLRFTRILKEIVLVSDIKNSYNIYKIILSHN